MIYKIECEDNKKFLKEFPKHIRKDMYEQYSEWFYFDNLITAFKVARLKSKTGSVKCKICVVKKEKAQYIPKELIVSSVEEYLALTTKKTNQMVEKCIKDLKENTK